MDSDIRNALFSVLMKRYVFAFIQIINGGVYQSAQCLENHIRHGVNKPDFDIAVQWIAVDDNAFNVRDRADNAHIITEEVGIDTADKSILLHIALYKHITAVFDEFPEYCNRAGKTEPKDGAKP